MLLFRDKEHVADSLYVDERRSKMGLPPLAEYMRLIDSLFMAPR
jgi:hypothetical protein